MPVRLASIHCARPHLQRTQWLNRLDQLPQCAFHASPIFRSESIPNHYEALELPTTASAAEIKRKFYTLSKLHHPDHNPSDPGASARFVRISEAYHVLGSPEKKRKYDRELHAFLHPTHRHHHPSGSHSSHATGPAGSRPASGLSRRRATFRGPPPSFYRQGGYGAHGAKREQHAPGAGTGGAHFAEGGASAAGSGTTDSSAAAGAASRGGFGPGQRPLDQQGYSWDIPHWDRASHHRSQEGLQARKRRAREPEIPPDQIGGSVLFNFFLISGVICFIMAVPAIFSGNGRSVGTATGNGNSAGKKAREAA